MNDVPIRLQEFDESESMARTNGANVVEAEVVCSPGHTDGFLQSGRAMFAFQYCALTFTKLAKKFGI